MKKKKSKNWIFIMSSIFLGFIIWFIGLFGLSGNIAIIVFSLPIAIYSLSMLLSSTVFKLKAKDYILPILILTISFFVIAYLSFGIIYLLYYNNLIGRINDISRIMTIPSIILNPFMILFFNYKEK